MHLKKIFTICAVLLTAVTHAQQNISLYMSRNLQATYDKGTRTTSGEPGKNYWQNSANYTITVDFDPVTRLVSGNEDILYTNNSPDTLKQVWFKLYPNLYKKGNIRESQIQPAIGCGAAGPSSAINWPACSVAIPYCIWAGAMPAASADATDMLWEYVKISVPGLPALGAAFTRVMPT